ncbi:hypothetical protein [Salinicola rhizosphaerae]|uniref:Uncharacterized protein n=1 Tax=Salinicola rhizosphaerae TaxID=1443141 RepID=A0ABQ3E3L2_9GAMM|nr:hypothetical protein [Salinicola rhizosphaerae]GHB25096.1 hypothetical protein GCM10009038_25230 [Salinicola rhizosphaerae]
MKKLNAAIFAAMLALPTAAAFAQDQAPAVSPESGSANTQSGGSSPYDAQGATAAEGGSGSLPSENNLPDENNGQTGSANTQPGSLKAAGPTAQDKSAAQGKIHGDSMEGNHGVDSAQDVDPES